MRRMVHPKRPLKAGTGNTAVIAAGTTRAARHVDGALTTDASVLGIVFVSFVVNCSWAIETRYNKAPRRRSIDSLAFIP
jgi:hypothetical protein